MKLFKGNIIYTKNKESFEVYKNGFICEDKGKVIEVGYNLDQKYQDVEIDDYSNHLLMPGFVDLHFHAVQYGNLGIGLDEELLDWLNKYTFKEEEKFEDLAYAQKIFESALNHIIKSGTTSIVFFSSIHEAATKLLIDLCEQKGISAFVGKVNMDRNASEGLLENKDQSVDITRRLLKLESQKVKAIITPRFVPSCTGELMKDLGVLAGEGYPVQTHISENEHEIEWVKALHPDAKNYLDVYDQCGLIGPQTILAHCVFCNEEEKELIKTKRTFVAHCPTANLNLTSGIMNAKEYLDRGIRIGLGTDVGAGHTASIRNVMVHTMQMSKVNRMLKPEDSVLTFSEVFFMATKGGGEFFGNVGSFEPEYDLDLLVVAPDDLADIRDISVIEQLQRFVYSGENHQIKTVISRGKTLKPY